MENILVIVAALITLLGGGALLYLALAFRKQAQKSNGEVIELKENIEILKRSVNTLDGQLKLCIQQTEALSQTQDRTREQLKELKKTINSRAQKDERVHQQHLTSLKNVTKQVQEIEGVVTATDETQPYDRVGYNSFKFYPKDN